MTSKKNLTIYNDYKDLTLSLICALTGFASFLFCQSVADDDTKLTVIILFIISAVVSLNYSIKANKTITRAVLYFVLKVILSLLLLLKLLELIGYKNNESNEVTKRTKIWQLMTTGIFSLLIFDLIKEHRWKGNFDSRH